MKEIVQICKKYETVYRKGIGGFVTLEYTFLLPVFVLLYAFLICIGLYLYNSCILATNVYILASEGGRLSQVGASGKLEALREKETRLYHDKYLLATDVHTTYSIRGDFIRISGDGKMGNPFGKFGIGEEYWTLHAEAESRIISPMETLRLCKAVYNVVQERIMEVQGDDS